MKHRRIRYGGPRQTAKKPQSIDSPVEILSLSLDGRGVARPEGKTLFVRDALPGEQVEVTIEKSDKRFDEGVLANLILVSADRIEPNCPHYGRCGGCDLQHLSPEAAIELKQQELLTQLAKRAKVEPLQVDPALISREHLAYRRAARIGINQRESGEILIGFRRRNSAKLVDIDRCPVLTPKINAFVAQLRQVLNAFERIKHLTQIEIIEGARGLVAELRTTKNLSDELHKALKNLATEHAIDLRLSVKEGATSKLADNPQASKMIIRNSLQLEFDARDFVQVNAPVNELMIDRVLEWLAPLSSESALDLFSGLGNFSLPLAQKVAQVTAVEGSVAMVERCLGNAKANGINNLNAYSADLSQPDPGSAWLQQGYDLVLLDPPRQGAAEIIPLLGAMKPRAIAYIACDPASLVRDAANLVSQGFRLSRLCVADMFPQTHHVESLALFEAI